MKTVKEVIQIFLVDDHQIFLDGLARLIGDHPRMKIVGTSTNGRDALLQIKALKPAVVLMDVSMDQLNGIEAARAIRKTRPNSKVLILSMHDNEAFVLRALKAGAAGYILKDSAADELFLAIEEVFRGNCYLSSLLSHKIAEGPIKDIKGSPVQSLNFPLTEREQGIVQMIAEGYSNGAIAKCLCLSPRTIETHRKNIMKKLCLHRTADLVRYAIQSGIMKL